MSDEENKNEEKPTPTFKVRENGIYINGATGTEPADERCKDIGENEIEVEVAYRISPNGKIVTRAKIPAFLLGMAGKIVACMAKDMDRYIDKTTDRMRAYDEGFKDGQEAAHKPATDGEAEATPSPAATPDAGTEAPAAE